MVVDLSSRPRLDHAPGQKPVRARARTSSTPASPAAPPPEKGTLTLMVGGERERRRRAGLAVRPSPPGGAWAASGAGHTTKLLNNFLNAVSLAATAEVMVAGKKAGSTSCACWRINSSSRGQLRQPQPQFAHRQGDYLEGGLTGN